MRVRRKINTLYLVQVPLYGNQGLWGQKFFPNRYKERNEGNKKSAGKNNKRKTSSDLVTPLR